MIVSEVQSSVDHFESNSVLLHRGVIVFQRTHTTPLPAAAVAKSS